MDTNTQIPFNIVCLCVILPMLFCLFFDFVRRLWKRKIEIVSKEQHVFSSIFNQKMMTLIFFVWLFFSISNSIFGNCLAGASQVTKTQSSPFIPNSWKETIIPRLHRVCLEMYIQLELRIYLKAIRAVNRSVPDEMERDREKLKTEKNTTKSPVNATEKLTGN